MIFCTKRLFEKLILVDYGSFGSSVGFNSVQIFFGINLSLLTFSVLQVLLGTVAHTVWLEGTGLREVRWLHCWVATSRHLGSWHCTWRHLATGLLTATCRHTSCSRGTSRHEEEGNTGTLVRALNEGSRRLRKDFTITEKALTKTL